LPDAVQNNTNVPPTHPVALRTPDAVTVIADHWDATHRELCCVICHGFTGSARHPRVNAISAHLAAAGTGVLALDFRGHGRSGGHSTVGAAEIHDIAAAIDWARGAGYRRVATLGWSMGGSAVLRHAGLGGDADAVVSVSSPGHWYERGTRVMRVVTWMCDTRSGRAVTRVVRRTRLLPGGWVEAPEAPVEVISRIAPTPLLLVHGDADHYFPTAHVDELAAAAPHAEVWIEPGMGHAENATTAQLLDRILFWVRAAADSPSVRAAAVCDDEPRERA
jgi:pimeloyl-ACP methyl ester carboxylesterase